MLSLVLTRGFAGRERGKAHFTIKVMRWIVFLACLAAAFAQTHPQTTVETPPEEKVQTHTEAAVQTPAKELDVSAADAWVDTGLDLRAGDVLTIGASGRVKVRSGK